MTYISNNKRLRAETTVTIDDSFKRFPKKLPQAILELFSTFLNVRDTARLARSCKSFRSIPDFYLSRCPHQIIKVIEICYKKRYGREHGREPGLHLLSSRWRTGFTNGLTVLEEINLLGLWGSSFHEYALDDLFLQIIPLAKQLKKISIKTTSELVVDEIDKLNLTELRIITLFDISLSKLWDNASLKNLVIHTTNFIPKLSKEIPNLEKVSITLTRPVRLKNLHDFIVQTHSFQKLYINVPAVLQEPLFLNHKNLKELCLFNPTSSYEHPNFNSLKFAYSLENLILHDPRISDDFSSFEQTISAMEKLTKVTFIFESVRWEILDHLANMGITKLDKVIVRIIKLQVEEFRNLHKYDFSKERIRHLSLHISIKELETVPKFTLHCIHNPIIRISHVEEVDIELLHQEYATKADLDRDSSKIFGYLRDVWSEKITSLRSLRLRWGDMVLKKLKKNPLKNCKKLSGIFYTKDGPIPTKQLLELFPAVTENNIDRIWTDR